MRNIEKFLHLERSDDYFSRIASWQRTFPDEKLYVWGAGSVSIRCIEECKKRGISIDGCFVNVDEYHVVPKLKALEIPIFQLKDLLEAGNNFSIIVGHSNYQMTADIEKYEVIKNVWQPVNVGGSMDMSSDFVRAHMNEYQASYDMLADEKSRRNMLAFLNAICTGDNSWITREFENPITYFDNDVFSLYAEAYLDAGAHNGKSIDEFIKRCPNFSKIIGVEVQTSLAAELKKRYILTSPQKNIQIMNIGLSDHIGMDYLHIDDEYTFLTGQKEGDPVEVTTIDEICKDEDNITLIKICVPDSIVPFLKGAERTIERFLPKFVIAAGLDRRALLDYLPILRDLSRGRYEFYLRFTTPMVKALALFAVSKQDKVF